MFKSILPVFFEVAAGGKTLEEFTFIDFLAKKYSLLSEIAYYNDF